MTHHKAAGVWLRFAAFGLDAGIFILAFAAWLFLVGFVSAFLNAGSAFMGSLLMLGVLGVWAGSGIYTVLMLKGSGQTLGKRLLGLRVVREGEAPVGGRAAFLRWLGYHLTALTAGLGFVAAAFNPGHRTLHDAAAGTRVIRVGTAGPALQALGAALGCLLGLCVVLSYAVVKKGLRNMETAEVGSKESDARAGLETLRSAISAYSADRGAAPKSLQDADFVGMENHLVSVPELDLPYPGHAPSQRVETGKFAHADGGPDAAAMRDTGHWAYDPSAGAVFVDCTHLDSEGNPAYTW